MAFDWYQRGRGGLRDLLLEYRETLYILGTAEAKNSNLTSRVITGDSNEKK